MKKLLLLAIVVLGFSAVSFGQAQTTATASAKIVIPISVAKNTDLNFGNIAVGATGGTVEYTATGVRTATGGVKLPAVTGSPAVAKFTVSGEGNSAYTMTFSASTEIANTSDNTKKMTISLFTTSLGGTNVGTLSGIAGASGSQEVTVGATLTVDAAQLAGQYQGTFPVTVNYN